MTRIVYGIIKTVPGNKTQKFSLAMTRKYKLPLVTRVASVAKSPKNSLKKCYFVKNTLL